MRSPRCACWAWFRCSTTLHICCSLRLVAGVLSDQWWVRGPMRTFLFTARYNSCWLVHVLDIVWCHALPSTSSSHLTHDDHPIFFFYEVLLKPPRAHIFFEGQEQRKSETILVICHPKLAGNYYLVILGQEIMITIMIRMMMIITMPGIYPPFLPPFIYQVCQVLKLQRMPFGWWMNTVVPFTRISLTKLPATVGGETGGWMMGANGSLSVEHHHFFFW